MRLTVAPALAFGLAPTESIYIDIQLMKIAVSAVIGVAWKADGYSLEVLDGIYFSFKRIGNREGMVRDSHHTFEAASILSNEHTVQGGPARKATDFSFNLFTSILSLFFALVLALQHCRLTDRQGVVGCILPLHKWHTKLARIQNT